MTGQGWRGDALCTQTDPEVFFPEKGESNKSAKKVCAACPVAAECLEYALAHSDLVGVWGGTSAKGRQRIRERASQRAPLKSHAARGAAGAAVKRQRSQERSRRVVELHDQGYGTSHIAAVVGVTVDSVRRYVREAARREAA